MACGQRPISNVVDITNYVMLLTGQPMHAFDYDRVAGRRLNVRRARPGEQIQTLDEQVRTLDQDIVVIEDADGPTSLAGVMGGARSEVSDSTTSVLSEVATWNGPNIHATGLKLNLRSEALVSLREAAAARADAVGAGCGHQAVHRGLRRGRAAGNRRYRRAGPGAAHDPAARRPRRRIAGRGDPA